MSDQRIRKSKKIEQIYEPPSPLKRKKKNKIKCNGDRYFDSGIKYGIDDYKSERTNFSKSSPNDDINSFKSNEDIKNEYIKVEGDDACASKEWAENKTKRNRDRPIFSDRKSQVTDSYEIGYSVKRPRFSHSHEYNTYKSNEHMTNNDQESEDIKTKNESEKDEKLFDLIAYFENILKTFETIPQEDKEMFVSNVLQESKDYEIQLSCHGSSSHCIELLLTICKDPNVWIQFMGAFTSTKSEVCMNRNASHVTELLLSIAVKSIQNWSTILESVEDSSEKQNVCFFISWINEFGTFIVENLETFLQDQYASHVACTIVWALGGDMSKISSFMSKKSVNHKKDFHQQYVGEDDSKSTQFLEPVILDVIPKFFKKILKQLTKSLLKIENISDYVMESSSATVIEALLSVLKKWIPKYCKKLVSGLSSSIFSKKDADGIPLAFLHRNMSFVVESLFLAADEELQHSFWEEYVLNCLEPLITHRVGNHIIQRLFAVVENKSLFQTMSEKTGNLFEKILSSRHYGIFLSIAGACNRLKIQQAQFMKNIMQCLHCAEPEDRQTSLVPLLLGFQVFDNPKDFICLQGSLLVQAILKFQKPIKVVTSLLNMKPQQLQNLACHIQGCHVLHSFFSTNTIGEKNKDKLINCLKPCLVNLACDRNGSMTLSRLWVLLSIKQKAMIAQTFLHEKNTLQSDKNGNILLKKFSIFYFQKDYTKWREIQNNLSNSNCKM